jgi:penicillin-binding protein 1A
MVLGAIAGGIVFYWLDKNILSELPSDLSELRHFRPPTSSLVYSNDGTLVDEFYLERRIWVPLSELPPIVWRAFVASEDRRFFEHEGFDLIGIARAAIRNFQTHGISQGGSTITQQLVKNLIVGKERSYKRKLKELVLAHRLDDELKKEEILELYVNYVYLGSGNYGVEAAARDYFGLSARELNAGQAALLSGLVPAPSRYSPRSHPDAAMWRRSVVLRSMVEEGYIDQETAQKYLEAPVLQKRDTPDRRGLAVSYVTQVRRELRRVLGRELTEKGFKVNTPLDLRVQAVAEAAVRKAVRDLEERQGRTGPVRRLEPDKWEDFLASAPEIMRDPRTGQLLPPRAGQCFEALVGKRADLGELRAGPWTFDLVRSDRELKIRGHTEVTQMVGDVPLARTATTGTSTHAVVTSSTAHVQSGVLSRRVRPGDTIRVCVIDGFNVRLDPRPWAEGAAVVIENATGRIIALVGGYDVGLEGFVRATQAERQPGSSFKIYVYTSALLKDHTQIDTVIDSPLSLPAGGGKVWRPKNYDGRYFGALPLQEALARSLNTVSVRLALEVGPGEIARLARSMGVKTKLRSDVTIALGSSEVTPMDQALGYATVARGGVTTDAVYVDRLIDVGGKEVGRAGQPVVVDGAQIGVLSGGAGRRVLPAGVAYEMADMLRQVVNSGTARKAFKKGYDRAGKTGTTNECVDAWFVGFTPRYTVAVWIGTDGTFSLGDKETGGRAALPAWIQIVEALPAVEGERLPIPDDAVLVKHGDRWVGLPRSKVPKSVLAPRVAGTEPLPPFGSAARVQ